MPKRSLPRTISANLLLALLYFVLGRFCLPLSVVHVTPVWLPSGLSLAAILLLGYELWPGVFLGAFAVSCVSLYDPASVDRSLLVAAGTASGSTLEALTGGWLVKRFASGASFLERAENVFRFCYLGAFLSAAVACICGISIMLAAGIIQMSELRQASLTWWTGDMVGILVLTPLIVAWICEPRQTWDFLRVLEALLLAGLILGIGLLAFGSLEFRVEYMLIPCVVWAAFRFDQKGATLAIAVIFCITLYGTLSGYGSFVLESANESLLLLQAFVAVIAITTLFLSAVLAERLHSTERLVSAMKEMERAKQEAVEANLAKSSFLFNMNHELRTPLNHIIGYSDLLKEETADVIQPDLKTDIEKINEAGKHLLNLVSQILDLSALETGHMETSLKEFPVRDLVAEVAAVTLPLAEKNGNGLHYQVSDGCGTMKTDREKVRRVLLNLLNNACKFTNNGRIDLEVRCDPRQGIVFMVRDTGIGIPRDHLERVFRPFAQASSGSTKEYGGLGLGLAMSRLYSRLLGGDITVESEPGKGSTFVLQLPRAGEN